MPNSGVVIKLPEPGLANICRILKKRLRNCEIQSNVQKRKKHDEISRFISREIGEKMNKSIRSLKIAAMAIAISSSMAFGAVSDKCKSEITGMPSIDLKELGISVAKVKGLCKKKFTCPADDKITDIGLTAGCVKQLPEDPKGLAALLKDIGVESGESLVSDNLEARVETQENETPGRSGQVSRRGPKNIRVPGDYKTISDALGNADAGDTVFVKRGVYNENVTLVMDVVLKGEDPLTTIIDGGRWGPTVMGVTESEISHFTIRNGTEGILCENTGGLYIHDNIILDNHATGVAAFISLPEIANNVIYGNRWSGILAWGAKSLDSKIEHNVVLRNGYSGLALKGPSNVVAVNNIFMENHYYGVFADPASGQTRMDYNNIYKNYYPFNRFIKVNRTNVSLDPVFRNPSIFNPNFFVQPKSPMVKRGQNRRDIGLIEDISVVRPKIVEEVPQAAPEPEPEFVPEEPEFVPEPEPEPEPEPPPPPPPPKKVFVVEGVNFVSGKADITDESFGNLMVVVETMQTYPEVTFKIVGHTDDQGRRDANQKLSESRAKAVVDFLISRGISASRLDYEGRGPDQPIASNKTAAGRAKNRRIEFQRTDN
jgi:outer membrane protein OmpA-like peptidoglycan-associated protein